MRLNQFVKLIKEEIARQQKGNANIVFVSGNSSADLDSITSCITYSYLQYKSNGKWVFPLINIPKRDINLRRDVHSLFNDVSINTDDLIFIDDLKTISSPLDFILVDHNSPQGFVKEYIEKHKNTNIDAIIDHHVDEGRYLNASPRIIEPCGSCSSLINVHFKETVKRLDLDENELKMFISGVCADTSGLKNRVETKDIESISLFGLNASGLVDLTAILRKAKDDITGLSMLDLLCKDYKEFDTNRGKLGISSTTANFQYFKKEFNDDGFLKAVQSWIEERGIFELVIMTSGTDENGDFHREIGFSSPTSLSGLSELSLDPINNIGEFQVFNQRNIKASRKQVAPLLVNLYNQ